MLSCNVGVQTKGGVNVMGFAVLFLEELTIIIYFDQITFIQNCECYRS